MISIGGVAWGRPNGSPMEVHCGGIALSPDRKYLYDQALTSRTLYRIETGYLKETSLSEKKLQERVGKIGAFGPVNGIEFDHQGNIYLSSIEENAIQVLSPRHQIRTLIQSSRLDWPGSFALNYCWQFVDIAQRIEHCCQL